MPRAADLIARQVHDLGAEWPGRGRLAAAVGLGVFVGCIPLFGSHVWVCAGLGWLFRLSRLKMSLAANITNPLLAPLVVFAEFQLGSYLQEGVTHRASLAVLAEMGPWHVTADLLVGAIVVGTALACAATTATWAYAEAWFDPGEEDLIAGAAARYLPVGVQAWKMANAKLRFDPVYREAVRVLDRHAEARVLDLGCGRGLMLALLAAVRERRGGRPPLLLHGIDYRRRMVGLARRALGGDATIEQADLTTCGLPPCRVAILFDVLHCLAEPVQEALLSRLRDSVEPGGVLLLREADAGGGARFAAVQVTNRLVALLQGRWGRRFHFRTAAGWVDLLRRFGFDAEVRPNGESTPFANVLILARRAG